MKWNYIFPRLFCFLLLLLIFFFFFPFLGVQLSLKRFYEIFSAFALMFNVNLNTYQSSVSEENAYLQNSSFHSTLDSFFVSQNYPHTVRSNGGAI